MERPDSSDNNRMENSFTHTTLGNTGLNVFRLGLSAVYRPGVQAINEALDKGINYIFYYNFDSHMIKALKQSLEGRRDKLVLASGAYKFPWWKPNLIKVAERRLKQLKIDCLDILYVLGIKSQADIGEDMLRQLDRLKTEGKIRFSGISTHNRKLAGKLADEGAIDILMIRYNAAHRGAETDIFPYLKKHNPGLVSYTATRWRQMMKRPRDWQVDGEIPTAGMAYRFVLSNPNVDLTLTAPANPRQLQDNILAISKGPLTEDEMAYMRNFGDAVYRANKRGWD